MVRSTSMRHNHLRECTERSTWSGCKINPSSFLWWASVWGSPHNYSCCRRTSSILASRRATSREPLRTRAEPFHRPRTTWLCISGETLAALQSEAESTALPEILEGLLQIVFGDCLTDAEAYSSKHILGLEPVRTGNIQGGKFRRKTWLRWDCPCSCIAP